DYCNSETEAKVKAMEWTIHSPSYPVYFFKTDTSGEKSFEEFYTQTDVLDTQTFQALGVIKDSPAHPKSNLNATLKDFRDLFTKDRITKSDIISLLNQYLPDFSHIETGKSLDQKM
ncbi:MAG: nucleoside-diphosphate sugar epimerase, partial [Bacteroidota bacterium]